MKKSYDYDNLKNLINEIPIYYRSWQELFDGFESGIHEYADPLNHEHWVKTIDEVKELATRAGQYK